VDTPLSIDDGDVMSYTVLRRPHELQRVAVEDWKELNDIRSLSRHVIPLSRQAISLSLGLEVSEQYDSSSSFCVVIGFKKMDGVSDSL